MIIDIGYIFLAAALAVSVYGVIVPHLGVVRNNWNLVRSTQFSTILTFFLVLIASAVLVRAFIGNNFGVVFVWQNSSTDLPLFYKVTALWGGMDGSLLFWELVLAGFSAIVAFAYQRTNRQIIPYVISTLNVIQLFLLFLLVTFSNPFNMQFPPPVEGRGLNPLLQHPAMAIHPPFLYLGYIGFSIPFAFAIACLIRGKLDNSWVVTTRRWTLFAWYALTVGQMQGGQWAYEELGWGGYWGWDPVENASLMPWLTGTAFLHSIMLQEKRNMMKVWNMVLIILTFGLSILGTFIVRSGVLNSVHAFAKSEIGPAFLIFIALVLVLSFTLLFGRMKLLESRHTAESLTSKESAFLLNNLLLIGIAFTVFLGTIFPLVAEAVRGTKLSIQAPFFNTITAPMGVALLFLLGLCTLMAWRHSSLGFIARRAGIPLAVAAATAAILAALGLRHGGALLVLGIAAFTGVILVRDYFSTVRVRARQLEQPFFSAALSTIMRNQQRFGGLVIHLGVVFLFVGLTGNLLNSEKNLTLAPDERATVGEYQLLFKGMKMEKEKNASLRAAVIEVYREGALVETLKPARSFYPTKPDPLTEVAILRNIRHDLYLVLASENENGTVTIRARINPLVVWAWMAFPLFSVGTLIAMLYKPRRLLAPAAEKGLGYV